MKLNVNNKDPPDSPQVVYSEQTILLRLFVLMFSFILFILIP